MNLTNGLDINQNPIQWNGDLSDDCSANWAGLLLRAEKMDENSWWWAVYDMEKGEITIDSSNEYEVVFYSGYEARLAAEQAARIYLESNE
jgi:hypothetical protein